MTFENSSALTNATKMSLDQRFTQLRSDMRGRGPRRGMSLTDLRPDELRQSASAKSRRLAMQMSQRPTVIAALNGGQANRRGNLGNVGGITRRGQFRGRGGRGGTGLRTIGRDRRPNPNFAGGNRLRRSSSVGRLPRSPSFGRLSRSQSLQSLNNIRAASPSPYRSNRGGRARGRGGGGRGRGLGNTDFFIGSGTLSGVRTGRVDGGPRGRGRGRGGFVQRRNDSFTPRRRGRGAFINQISLPQQQQQQGNRRGGPRGGRSFRRGGRRGGGQGGRQQQQQPPPSKEKLDMELDEYMAATKANLDKEIDSYMSKTEEVWEV